MEKNGRESINMKITEEQKALLSLIANSLFGVKAEIPCNTDFNRLLTESKQQAVTALALKNVSMPENVKDTNTVFKYYGQFKSICRPYPA